MLRLRGLDLEKDAETVKTTAAILKTQLNLASVLIELPENIKQVSEDAEKLARKKQAFQMANEPDFAPHKRPTIVTEGVN